MHILPSYARETALRRQGYRAVAGVDEVGRGPLAGPVVAGAVVLPPQVDALGPEVVRDSKLLTPRQRERAYGMITREAVAWGVGEAGPAEIDALGIVAATRVAMGRALEALPVSPDFLLIDALTLPRVPLPQEGIIHGDRQCLSIAAASVVAKVTRDRMMVEEDRRHPGYGFARHKGYPSREHLLRLGTLGPCSIHRRSFGPVRALLEGGDDDPWRRQDGSQLGEAPPRGIFRGAAMVPGGERGQLGARGEEVAAAYLHGRGYAVLERNYRCPAGEMDIIARDGHGLVFVEVRTRRSGAMGTAEESVTQTKQRRLIAVAQHFLQERSYGLVDWRIDVVAVRMRPHGEPQVEYIPYAVMAH